MTNAATIDEVLRLARDKVASGWSELAEARDRWGRPVAPTSPEAVAWNVAGAIVAAAAELQAEHAVLIGALDRMERAVSQYDPVGMLTGDLDDWNDLEFERTQDDILIAFALALQ